MNKECSFQRANISMRKRLDHVWNFFGFHFPGSSSSFNCYNFMNTCFVRFMLWDVVCRSEREQSDLICASSKVVRYFFIARVEFHTWFMNAQSTQSTAKQCWTICCWPNSIPINHIRVFFLNWNWRKTYKILIKMDFLSLKNKRIICLFNREYVILFYQPI